MTYLKTKDTVYNYDKIYYVNYDNFIIGRILIVKLNEAQLPLMNAEVNSTSAGFTFGYTEVKYGGEYVTTRAIHYLHTTDSDTWEDNDKTGYYVKLEEVGQGLSSTGGNITGDLSIGGKLSVTGVASCTTAPTQGVDLCNKQYVDGKFGSIFNYDAETRTLTITTT